MSRCAVVLGITGASLHGKPGTPHTRALLLSCVLRCTAISALRALLSWQALYSPGPCSLVVLHPVLYCNVGKAGASLQGKPGVALTLPPCCTSCCSVLPCWYCRPFPAWGASCSSALNCDMFMCTVSSALDFVAPLHLASRCLVPTWQWLGMSHALCVRVPVGCLIWPDPSHVAVRCVVLSPCSFIVEASTVRESTVQSASHTEHTDTRPGCGTAILTCMRAHHVIRDCPCFASCCCKVAA